MVYPYSLVAQNSSHVNLMMEMVSSCSSEAPLDLSLRIYNRPPFEDRPIVHVMRSKDLVLRISQRSQILVPRLKGEIELIEQSLGDMARDLALI